MSIICYHHQGKAGIGHLHEQRVYPLGIDATALKQQYLARPGQLDQLCAQASAQAGLPLADVAVLPTLFEPEKIFCVGVNYAERNEEYKDNSAAPKYPSLFMRTATTFVGHGQPLLKPTVSDQFDYEGEIVLIVGREGRNVPRGQALEHIAGLCIANEGSVRDWLRHGKFNVTQGKNFEASGSIGPWMTRLHDPSQLRDMRLQTWVNDELRQDDVTGNMIFGFDHLIEYISTFSRLMPGDVILTGTPTGAGARFDPPRYLKRGDRVRIGVSGLGVLENTVGGG
ncbi:2-hydroxyhepta-2,4-diene-1,7-dioate isomerase [Bordetella petrii]|nr:2-hydroxyhepta-2,4-diene-1,7-dioate isomerase [Bordetella petrii]